MKMILKILFLLIVFMGLHAVLRLLYTKAVGSYEMSLPHCGGCVPYWLLWVAMIGDYFFYFPSSAYPVLSDLLWGCVGLVGYRWAEKRRKTRRKLTPMIYEAREGTWPPSPKPPKTSAALYIAEPLNDRNPD